MGDVSFKGIFPRLYLISNQQSNYISDMGYWDGQVCRWMFRWRRNFMNWERELFEQLVSIFPQNPAKDGEDDKLIWNFDDS